MSPAAVRRPGWARHAAGLAAVALGVGGMALFRARVVEPPAWDVLCAAPSPPFACLPRGWLAWLQNHGLWGAAALLLGVLAFRGAAFWVRVAAVGLGGAALLNYNATWGVLGAALGVWAWAVP